LARDDAIPQTAKYSHEQQIPPQPLRRSRRAAESRQL
jgi:hypothetical protein